MPNVWRAALVLTLVAGVAACSEGPAPSAPAASTAAPAVATTPASISAAPTSSSTVYAEHGAPELEAMLPDQLAGVPTTKTSLHGLPTNPGTTTFPPTHDGLAALLALLGKTPDDLRYAMATTGPTVGSPLIYLLQIRGVDAGQVASMSGAAAVSLVDVTIGGKRVRVMPGLEGKLVIYEKGELLFLLEDVPVADQPAALASLP